MSLKSALIFCMVTASITEIVLPTGPILLVSIFYFNFSIFWLYFLKIDTGTLAGEMVLTLTLWLRKMYLRYSCWSDGAESDQPVILEPMRKAKATYLTSSDLFLHPKMHEKERSVMLRWHTPKHWQIFIHIEKPFLCRLFNTFVDDAHTGSARQIISHCSCISKNIKIRVYQLFPRRFYNVLVPLEDDGLPCSILNTWPHLQASRKRVRCFIAFLLWNIISQRGNEFISYLGVIFSTSEAFIERNTSFRVSNDEKEENISSGDLSLLFCFLLY